MVAQGTPEDVAKVKESYTGQYLRELLGRRAGGTQKESSAARRAGGAQDKSKRQAAE